MVRQWTVSFSWFGFCRQPQKDIQSKSLTINNDADDLSAQHLHQTDLSDERKQRRNNLSDSTELSSSVESLTDEQHKQQVRSQSENSLKISQSDRTNHSNSLKITKQNPFFLLSLSLSGWIATTHFFTVGYTSIAITITTALRRITIEIVSFLSSQTARNNKLKKI